MTHLNLKILFMCTEKYKLPIARKLSSKILHLASSKIPRNTWVVMKLRFPGILVEKHWTMIISHLLIIFPPKINLKYPKRMEGYFKLQYLL